MQMLNATYSPDDNKLRLYASARLDNETYRRVRAAGFIWAAKQDLFVAPMWTPARADLLIELCGEIGDEDTSLTDRAEERADRFDTYRENRTADADAASAAVDRIASGIPMGQPILVGHHSEKHARRDAKRIEDGMRRAVQMWDTAEYWKYRAAGALRHAKYKERPDVRARRIKGLEADKRRQERSRDEAAKWIRGWGKLNHPHRGEELQPGVYAMDGAPCDDALRLKRALLFANYSHVSLPENDPRGYSVWSALDKGTMSPREAQILSLRVHARQIASARRWLVHLEHRLTYERAMLDEQGGTALLAPKPRSAKAQLPLCNYRAPAGVQVENMYHRGEFSCYPQIEMTSAEYAQIHADYKATRVVDGSHRVRTTMKRHFLVCVFLTDSKVHERPAPKSPTPPNTPAPQPRRAPIMTAAEPNKAKTQIDAMRATLKAGGVQVVSVAQLFPTPRALAGRMVDEASISPESAVLEPSAGTGAILDAIGVNGIVTAVEVNHGLCDQLQQRYQHARVICGDFLTMNGAIGRFDRIVMNPPFAEGQDIAHVRHAFEHLQPGGRLVAVMSEGPFFRSDRRARDFRTWLEIVGGTSEPLPAGTFSEAGTGVMTRLVIVDRGDA
jgi:phospholipid N-methyltransferase